MKFRSVIACLLVLVAIAPATVNAGGASWTVVYQGRGTYDGNASQSEKPLCSQDITSSVHTDYNWKVTWKHLTASPSRPPVLIGGAMQGTANQTASLFDDPNRCTYKTCTQQVALVAQEGADANQPAVLKESLENGKVALALEVLETPSTGGKQCANVGTYEPFYITGRGLTPSGGTLGAMFASAEIPLSQLRGNGKIVINVQSGPLNYPTNDRCQGMQIDDTTCSRKQDWTGSITLTRE